MSDQKIEPLRNRLVNLVTQILEKNAIKRPVSPDTPLNEAGMSSIDMVSLMLSVEAQFDVAIPTEEITPANFRTISTIEALIVRLVNQTSFAAPAHRYQGPTEARRRAP